MAAGLVWITGAGKGIGREVALAYARRGHAVAASARTAADLDSLAAASAGSTGSISGFPLDVTDPVQVADVVRRIEAEMAPIGIAVLNAGTYEPDSARGFKAERVRLLMETNVMGVVHGLEAVMPLMMARGTGTIAVVASLAGYRGLPGAAGYGASKAALINLCEALKPDLARSGVRLVLVNPGFVRTPLTDRNTFPMPFLMEAHDAAERMVRGIDGSGFEVVFPRRFALLMKLLRLLPYPLFFAATRRLLKAP